MHIWCQKSKLKNFIQQVASYRNPANNSYNQARKKTLNINSLHTSTPAVNIILCKGRQFNWHNRLLFSKKVQHFLLEVRIITIRMLSFGTLICTGVTFSAIMNGRIFFHDIYTFSYIKGCWHLASLGHIIALCIYKPPHEKTNILHMRKQRRRSISAYVFTKRIVQSLYFLNPKFQASSKADLRLCFRICKKPVFSWRGSNHHLLAFRAWYKYPNSTPIFSFFFWFSLTCLSRLFHSYRDKLIGRWGETGVPLENHLTHPQAELGLSHMWPVRILNLHQTQRWDTPNLNEISLSIHSDVG